jgi:hypothetical protein
MEDFKLLRGYTDPLVSLRMTIESLANVMENYNYSLIQLNRSLEQLNNTLQENI